MVRLNKRQFAKFDHARPGQNGLNGVDARKHVEKVLSPDPEVVLITLAQKLSLTPIHAI